MQAPGLTCRTITDIATVGAADWLRLSNQSSGPVGESANPFVSHAFLSALEASGCVGGRTGWHPAHQAVFEDGALVAAAPCYVKSHSQGEYVFDHAWADALQRAGGRYYPKLQLAVPFTPVTGPRILSARPADHAAPLHAGLRDLGERVGASSIHWTFLPEQQAQLLRPLDYLVRTDRQFHWLNEGYETFDHFLDSLASRKRKAIRRERKDALAEGITIERITGAAITEAHWDAFFAFYMDTGSRKWGRPYLNRRFFSLIGETMADQILLIMARRDGRYIAGAINFLGNKTLYGRNWGAIEEHPFLHFEVCYYQAIEFAIDQNLAIVEAGAQGEHKLSRGYRPVLTYSAHWIEHPGLRRAIDEYLLREQEHIAMEKNVLDSEGPFRRT